MINLFIDLAKNREEAINLLKENNCHIKFNDDAENDYRNDLRPFVLICDRHDMISDLSVSEVKLNDNDEIEIYVDDFEEWVEISECLSTTENNVYMSIEKQLTE